MKAAANPFRRTFKDHRTGYDASTQNQRSLIAKVKIAQKQLDLCDSDYRAILLDQTGKLSSTNLTAPELVKMVKYFESKGVSYTSAKAVSKLADHPAAMKARAMWISLHHLNAVRDPSEKALEAFAKRQLACEKLQWADQAQMFKLVEALKSWAEREGWSQDVPDKGSANHKIKLLKISLLSALVVKLKAAGLVGEGWNVASCAVRVASFEKGQREGPMFWELSELDTLARVFGDLLRTGERGSRR